MTGWEYRKIPLTQLLRKGDDVDLLCDAGREGWELIAILPNSVAYMKRSFQDQVPEQLGCNRSVAKLTGDTGINGAVQEASTRKVKAKYRDPKTNETWSGRGRMANWLKSRQDAGENIEQYLVQGSAILTEQASG